MSTSGLVSNLIIKQTLGPSEIGRLASVYHAWCMNLINCSQSNWRLGNQIGNNQYIIDAYVQKNIKKIKSNIFIQKDCDGSIYKVYYFGASKW
jgi:hypothetical protein